MKNVIITVCLISLSISAIAQKTKPDTKWTEYKHNKTGFIRQLDYPMDPFNYLESSSHSEITIFYAGTEKVGFLSLDSRGPSIEKSDITKLISACPKLKSNALIDAGKAATFIEGEYKTTDEFKLGYYISEGNIKWYFSSPSSRGRTFLDIDKFLIYLKSAETKINELL